MRTESCLALKNVAADGSVGELKGCQWTIGDEVACQCRPWNRVLQTLSKIPGFQKLVLEGRIKYD